MPIVRHRSSLKKMLVPVSLIDYQKISYPFHPPCDYHKLYESGSPEKQEENKIYAYIEEETFYFRHFIYLGIGFPKCGQWQGQSLQGGWTGWRPREELQFENESRITSSPREKYFN